MAAALISLVFVAVAAMIGTVIYKAFSIGNKMHRKFNIWLNQ